MSDPKDDASNKGDGRFPTTSWTLVQRLRSEDAADARAALGEICAIYHYPLYCYARRRGLAHHDAQDVLHDFLARLCQRRTLDRAEEGRGRLRGFLSRILSDHIADWRAAPARRETPAGDLPFCDGLDFGAIEDRYSREYRHPSSGGGPQPADAESPDRAFERQWARAVVRTAVEALAERYRSKGREDIHRTLLPVLERGGSLRGEDIPALAAALGTTEVNLRSIHSRYLREFRTAVEDAVRLTVEHAEDVPDEVAHLFRTLAE